ncbi:MAG: hypothetical protein ACK5UE_06605 [Chitinophagales bacterium]|jgi:hypothetical protein
MLNEKIKWSEDIQVWLILASFLALFILYDNDTNTKEFSYNCPINVSVYPLKRKIDHIAANFTNRRITNYLEI